MDNNLQCQVRIKRVYGTDNSKQRPNCWQMIMWAANNENKHLTTESEQSWAKFQNNLTSGEKSFFFTAMCKVQFPQCPGHIYFIFNLQAFYSIVQYCIFV